MELFTKLKDFELQSVPLQIASAIQKQIYKQELKPGDRLPKQEELAEFFVVSRPTIREALDLLVESQLIQRESSKSKSYIIANFHPDKALKSVQDIILLSLTFNTLTKWELFAIREMIEVPCAALAANNRTEEDLKELEMLLPNSEVLTRSVPEIFEADAKFHIKLAECTHNPLAKTLVESLVYAYFKLDIFISEAEKKSILEGLPEIFEAVKSGDETRARNSMERHMEHFKYYHGK
ncbi:FCD domain-containing protein [Planococcus sp. APC 3900]|uniref:FadR/GntR family transcriptional regulator n=1 Tax=Planococcus sp. APC 3900 TaxID=3035191 RepID=UPI0025B414A1|nr:FCD domain-containing protein [Planococcus sp. APC 3900]MDN3436835.1 FCD domain-containing protein [Planococcus sp. APC 3900]